MRHLPAHPRCDQTCLGSDGKRRSTMKPLGPYDVLKDSSVGPKAPRRDFDGRESNTQDHRRVSGHDFSRAEIANEKNWGFSPCAPLAIDQLDRRNFLKLLGGGLL